MSFAAGSRLAAGEQFLSFPLVSHGMTTFPARSLFQRAALGRLAEWLDVELGRGRGFGRGRFFRRGFGFAFGWRLGLGVGGRGVRLDADGLIEEVVVVAEDGGEGNAARFDDFFAEHLGGDVGDEVGADLDGAVDAGEFLPGIGAAADEVAADGAALDGDGGLGGGDGSGAVDGDFEDGVVVRGEPAADVVDAEGDEESAVWRGGDFRFVGAVVGARERVFGGLAVAFGPAAEGVAEDFVIDGNRGAGEAGGGGEKKGEQE